MFTSVFGPDKDHAYMHDALTLAHVAAHQGEVPVGAVVVNEAGDIIGRAHNTTEQSHTQAAHAEIHALQQAGHALGDWRLDGCWLYVTLEPCIMCMGLIALSRLAGVVYGASSPLFGSRLDKIDVKSVYKIDTLRIVPGVCAEESSHMLKDFFKKKRLQQ